VTLTRFTTLVVAAVLAASVFEIQAQTTATGVDSVPVVGDNAQHVGSNALASSIAFQLKPTAIAPAGAVGSAELKVGVLSLHLSHVGPGKYVVQGLSRPGHVPCQFGVIVIADPTSAPDRVANNNKKEASANPESTHLEIDVQITLPPELRSLEIANLRLLGPGGNAVLEGKAG